MRQAGQAIGSDAAQPATPSTAYRELPECTSRNLKDQAQLTPAPVSLARPGIDGAGGGMQIPCGSV